MGKLAIIGLGLIGGSMGLALKRAEPANTEVIGYDKNPEVMQRAHKAGVVQGTAPTLAHAVRDATMVIIASPIVSMRKVFQEMAPNLRAGAVVTDTASTKSDVLRWAHETLPANVFFVGGHPMAGKEKQGLHQAEASLFDERPYCVVPSVEAVPGAVNAVVGLAQALGAMPFFLDADEHDSYAAAISHVPLLTSVALFNLVRGSNAWPELANMAGPGFRDLTRLASGEPEMSHDIFLTNRDNVLHWLSRYISELSKLQELIEAQEDTESLYRSLAETQMEREQFLSRLPQRESPIKNVEFGSSAEAFMTILTGTLWQERAKELTNSLSEQANQRERERRLHRDLDDD
ncbi:MAG TPA: prephenate dehydrogenase/arogenate dehydrogenase family protein [Dehalococcoidia bacterium]|nr:prephenate dehydrogenase/arogenate dehydrogenase family protein [Dehalococcoidia bacterium]